MSRNKISWLALGGCWVDEEGKSIAVMNMDDGYLRDAICFAAMGLGWSPIVVLGCLDEMYRTAKERGIVKGLWGRWLRKRTERLWERRLENHGDGYNARFGFIQPMTGREARRMRRILGKKMGYGGNDSH